MYARQPMKQNALGLVVACGSLLVHPFTHAQPLYQYVGEFYGTQWSAAPYAGDSPGPGILTFQLRGVANDGNVSTGPLFIKCRQQTYSEYYEKYQKILKGPNLVWSLYQKYC